MPENISEKSGYGKQMKHGGEDVDREAHTSDRCTQLRWAFYAPLCPAFAGVTTPLVDVSRRRKAFRCCRPEHVSFAWAIPTARLGSLAFMVTISTRLERASSAAGSVLTLMHPTSTLQCFRLRPFAVTQEAPEINEHMFDPRQH